MVEIIPKPAVKLPKWFNVLFYFSLGLLLVVILSFFLVNHSLKESQKTLQDLEEVLVEERTPEKIILEKETLSYQKKIKDFSQLLNQHLFSSKFFEFIEKISHPRVWFFQVNLNPQTSQLLISGQTESFLTLGQQLSIFAQEPLIKTINLSQVSLTKVGQVEFVLDFFLDPKIFSPR